jgi:hypothetical protein
VSNAERRAFALEVCAMAGLALCLQAARTEALVQPPGEGRFVGIEGASLRTAAGLTSSEGSAIVAGFPAGL